MKWFQSSRTKDREKASLLLYGQLAATARSPRLFVEFGVPDSFDGRFDSLILHIGLMVARLSLADEQDRRQADRLSSGLAYMFIADMDRTVRELGVGDLSVGKKVKTMSKALYGRASAYHEALATHDGRGDQQALELALARNIWGGDVPENVESRGGVTDLAVYARSLWTTFQALSLDDIAAGKTGLSV